MNLFIITLLALLGMVQCRRSLSATSLVSCMENSQLTPSYFDVTFNPDDRSVRYNLDLNSEINGYVEARVQVFAYGFQIIEQTLDLCSIGWKQFCPLFPDSMQIEGIEYISAHYVNMIPGIAFQVPDIDAILRVVVFEANNTDGAPLACIQSSFSNGKTISHTAVKWVTAVIAGGGLLASALLSTFGNSNAASHVSANAVSLFLYFQSVVVVSMEHVQLLPPIASAWSENLAWSMGLIRVTFMQEVIRWYVQATGGTPALYLNYSGKQVLVQRGYDLFSDIYETTLKNTVPDQFIKRATNYVLESNASLLIFRGIKRLGFRAGIEETSIVSTGLAFFVICGYLLVGFLFIFKQGLELLIRWGTVKPNRATSFRKNFSVIFKGSILRYIYIGFTQVTILSLWEFVQQDSPAVIVLAVIFLITVIGVLSWSFYRTLQFGRESVREYNNPAALLYGNQPILDKYGFCYTMFNAQYYWWGTVLIGYNFAKCLFIGLAQASGKTQALAIFILDLAYTIYLIRSHPFLDKSTNIVNDAMSVVNTINSFLFLFFSNLFGQPAPVSSIMAWVFFILNAAFSLILLVTIIVFIVKACISKNPDARFAPARDDRTSFQRKASVKNKDGSSNNNHGAAELLALGAVAQDHQQDWANEIYKLNDLSHKMPESPLTPSPDTFDEKHLPSDMSGDTDELEPINSVPSDSKNSKNETSFANRWRNRLGRGKSLKKISNNDSNNARLSDTLRDDEDESTYEKDDTFKFAPGIPRDDSSTPINQHNRKISNTSAFSSAGFSAYSTNPVNQPVAPNDFVFQSENRHPYRE